VDCSLFKRDYRNPKQKEYPHAYHNDDVWSVEEEHGANSATAKMCVPTKKDTHPITMEERVVIEF
jgi:hypothetical protein